MDPYLGTRCRDMVTRTEGIVVARTEYLNGCVRYCIQPQVKEAHEIADKVEWIDSPQLEFLDDGVSTTLGRRAGSPDVAAVGGPPKHDAPAR